MSNAEKIEAERSAASDTERERAGRAGTGREDVALHGPARRLVAWPRPLRSLTSRFVATLVLGVLITSLAVTWISIQSTESFLREKIDHKFMSTLSAMGQRLELWHSERELEIETLARSTTLSRALASQGAGDLTLEAKSSSEADRYLSLVLDQLTQLDALFILDPRGEQYAWVGPERDLPASLRARLASIGEGGVGDLLEDEAGRLHISSAPVVSDQGQTLGSVHAVIRPASFDGLLVDETLGSYGRIMIVSRDHTVLAPREVQRERPRYERSLPEPGDGATVQRYEIGGEATVVGGTFPFSRFRWTLVVEEPYSDAFAPVVAIAARTAAINLAIVALFSSIAFVSARSIVRPMRALSLAADRIAAGECDVEIPGSSRTDEIGVLTRALHEMTSRLQSNQEDLREKNDALEHLAITDGLTGLYNHRYFQSQLQREMKRVARSKEALSLILFDIDDFKRLNDQFGHAVGDQTLKAVASAMREMTRESDLLARYGGEEFVLLSFGNALGPAGELAEKLRLAVSQARVPAPVGAGLEWVQVTVSVGVAQYGGDPGLFDAADRALYRAKAGGKDCVVTADEVDDLQRCETKDA